MVDSKNFQRWRNGSVSEEQQPNIEEAVEQEPTESLLEEAEEGKTEVEEAVDELTSLRQELEEARAREAEYLDGWQRARAELANARKRFQREQERSYSSAKADLLVRLLPIVDDFERAFEALPDNPSSVTWVEGVKLIHQKLQALLEQEGVAPIEATGKEFDPFLHQALTHEPSEDVPEGRVIAEVQRGYQVGDRVLRPSVVRVSSGPPPEPEPEPEAEPTEEDESPDERRS
jgi:molecular chaperone GrpE